MTDQSLPDRKRLERHIAELLEGTLSADDHAQLEAALAADSDLRAYYLDYTTLHSLLHNTEVSPHALDLLISDQVSAISDQQFVGNASHESPLTTHHSSLRTWDRALSRHRRGIGIAAGLAFVAALLGWAAMTYLPPGVAKNEEPQEETSAAEWIALLNHQHNAEWLDGTEPAPNRPRLIPGQRLAISTGLLEINYRTGTKVILEGPAEFVVGGTKAEGTEALNKKIARSSVPQSAIFNPQSSPANSGYLARGKLVARCDSEDAQGFTVETPTARIKDLGTEFGVYVDDRNANSVSVFEGRVAVSSGTGGFAPLELTSGQTMVFDENGVLDANRLAASQSIRFTRHVGDPSGEFHPSAEYVAAVKQSQPVAYWRFEHADQGRVHNEMSGDLPLRMAGDVRLLKITADNSVAMFEQIRNADALACDDVSAAYAGDYTFETWVLPATADDVSAAIAHVHAAGRGSGMMCSLERSKTHTETPLSIRYLHRWPLGIRGGKNVFSQTRIAANNWHHIVAVHEQGTVSLWLNGKREAAAQGAAPLDAADLQLVIGRLFDDARRADVRPFTGYIDEVALYDRALEPAEIAEHHRIATLASE